MIIVKLFGGLGNQMFQYAAGLCAAEKYKTTLKLDISALQKKNWADRKYSLGCFNVQERFTTTPYRFASLGNVNPGLYRLVNIDQKIFHLKEEFYSKNILNIQDNTYLDGQWQSEKYFLPIRKILLSEFSLKKPLSSCAQSFKNKIQKSASISIHVRRTDYLTAKMANVYASCPLSYYQKATRKIELLLSKPHYFIFTDDVVWAKDNLKFLKKFTIVSGHGLKDYEELFLMSQCLHNIIANSSFSWWGAWLNVNRTKMVFAPKKWYQNTGFEAKNLISAGWKTI